MKRIKAISVLQENKEFGEKIPLSADLEAIDVSTALKEALTSEGIELDQENIDNVLIKMLEHYPNPSNTNPQKLQQGANPGVSGDYSRQDHIHPLPSFNDLTEGTVKMENGGTGATTKADARKNLGVTIQLKQITLNHGSWMGEEFPYTYTIPLEEVTSENQIVYVYNDMGITEAQLDSFLEACITAKEQTVGQIVLQAKVVPEEDLPIVISIGGEPDDNN